MRFAVRPDVAGDVISGKNIKTIKGYALLNFEAAIFSSFRDKKAHQLVAQCETRRHTSHNDCRI